MLVLHELSYIFSVPVKIPAGFCVYVCVETDKYAKVYGNGNRPKITQGNLKVE